MTIENIGVNLYKEWYDPNEFPPLMPTLDDLAYIKVTVMDLSRAISHETCDRKEIEEYLMKLDEAIGNYMILFRLRHYRPDWPTATVDLVKSMKAEGRGTTIGNVAIAMFNWLPAPAPISRYDYTELEYAVCRLVANSYFSVGAVTNILYLPGESMHELDVKYSHG